METSSYYSTLKPSEKTRAIYVLRSFVEKDVVPAVLQQFPGFAVLVDDLDRLQSVYLVDMTKDNRKAVYWNFQKFGQFEVAIGDVKRESGVGLINTFRAGGEFYSVNNLQPVWYATEKRDIKFGGDKTKRTEMLHTAIEELGKHLKK